MSFSLMQWCEDAVCRHAVSGLFTGGAHSPSGYHREDGDAGALRWPPEFDPAALSQPDSFLFQYAGPASPGEGGPREGRYHASYADDPALADWLTRLVGDAAGGLLAACREATQISSAPSVRPVPEAKGWAFFDLRVPTATRFTRKDQGSGRKSDEGQWYYCQRIARIFHAEGKAIVLWSELLDANWPTDDPAFPSDFSVPTMNPPQQVGMASNADVLALGPFGFFCQRLLVHLDWQTNRSVRSGLEDWEREFFLAVEHDDFSVRPYLEKRLAKIVQSLVLLREAQHGFDHRVNQNRALFGEEVASLLKSGLSDLQADIAQLRGEARDLLQTSIAAAQNHQARLIERQGAQDRAFQNTISFIAAVVAVPSLIIGLYSLSGGVKGVPFAERGDAFWIVLGISFVSALATWIVTKLVASAQNKDC